MAFEVTLPRLGWSMETGKIAEWLKRSGQHVETGEILFTVEGDKAVQEVEALASGTLHIPPDSPPPGQELPVGTVLAYILEPDESAPSEAPGTTEHQLGPSGNAEHQLGPAPRNVTRSRHGLPTVSPRARRVATELGVNWSSLVGSGRSGRIVERDVRRAAPVAEARVSPVARRMAADLGVDVEVLAAQASGRRVTRADVEAAARAVVETTGLRQEITPVSAVRRLIAERMASSAHTAAPVTLMTEVDASEMVRLREQLKGEPDRLVPSYTDLLIKLIGETLREHPMLNAHFEGETIVRPPEANVGIAVDTERGLLVPVVRNVQAKTLSQIARESARLIEQARNGRINPDELRGGTFTVTNLGMYEIDGFTPIINLPECAILGFGRIVPKQVVVDVAAERLAIRHMAFLSLTFDHRLVDGGPAARFLQRLKQYVEKPYLWLIP
jgi:pyruvate dehydrogenase E2 component (dihydrolipoamide acetyltransferase)